MNNATLDIDQADETLNVTNTGYDAFIPDSAKHISKTEKLKMLAEDNSDVKEEERSLGIKSKSVKASGIFK